ncbi:MAG: tyrosine--tRNA ligase [bacterium]|nr:tyrosine--tRNA ligase [Candidatus Sumerlaeota bacterium]
MQHDEPNIPAEIREEFEVLASNTVDILPVEEFAQKLVRARSEGRPLRVKYGADPSAPDIHLGHSVPIRKLKDFQDWGHKVVFIIGDYTARIGDPSGKNSARPRLAKDEVNANAQTYLEQIFKILDREKTELAYNSAWLEPMTVSDTIELMSSYTVSQMLEREDFHNRFDSEVPIYIHEFIYPLLQGRDSIEIHADIEIGGTDQKFNLLVGRELQRGKGQEPQCIMTLPLLVGLDGTHKMSKSLGNYIGISENAQAMFGKAMSIPDDIMWDYFELAVGLTEKETQTMRRAVESGASHPRDVKEDLARRIVTLYHGADTAEREAQDFRARFTLRKFPEKTAERVTLSLADAPNLAQVLALTGAAKSSREAQRLAKQGAIKVIEYPEPHTLSAHPAGGSLGLLRAPLAPGVYKLKIGKTRFVVLTITP